MVRYRVVKKDGTPGVTVKEMLKTKVWRDLKSEQLVGSVRINTLVDPDNTNVYFSAEFPYFSGKELITILHKYDSQVVLRYGKALNLDRVFYEVDILK